MSRGKMKPVMTAKRDRSGRGDAVSPLPQFAGPRFGRGYHGLDELSAAIMGGPTVVVAPSNMAIGRLADPSAADMNRAARRRAAAKLKDKKP